MFSAPEGRAAPCPLDLWSEVRDEPHTVHAGCWGQVRGHLFVALLGHGLQGDGTAVASGKAGCPGVSPQGVSDRARPAQARDLYAGTGAAILLGSAGPASFLVMPQICGPLPISSLHRPHPWAVSSLPGGLPSSARKSPGAACPLCGSEVPPAPWDGGCPTERSIWMNMLPSSPLLLGKGETPAGRKKPGSERSTRSQLVVTLRDRKSVV